MAVPLEKFVKLIEDSGIVAADVLTDLIPPKAAPKDAEELARELIRQKRLTKFQAEEISRGKGKSLTLGNYILLEKIGAGGMGQVFKARHRRMDRLVAVKLLPSAMTKDQAAIARFEREVKAAARLRHTNIVAADDADEADGVHFLVMEYVEGSDLSALVKKNGPFPVAQAVNCILQAARGLEFAHGEGVVHRDVKPANLLLDRKGTVKILDLGLARIEGATGAQAELTSTGAVMGTVDYMAPEQALSTKTADARSDVYSLGISLWYLLTGRCAYDGDTLMAKLLAHRDAPIPSLSATIAGVPASVDRVFQKMIAKQANDRYQTMTEVIRDLEHCSGQLPSVSVESLNAGAKTQVTSFPSGNAAPTANSMSSPQQATAALAVTAAAAEVTMLTGDALQATNPQTHVAGHSLVPAPQTQQTNSVPVDWWRDRHIQIGGGAGALLLLLAVIVISLRTKHGTLFVEVDQPDAVVQVLDDQGKVEISQPGGEGKVTISVDPGQHRLKIEKDGFTVFGQEFEMAKNGKKTITAKLTPLEEKRVLAKKEGWHGWPADAPKPAIAPFDAAQAKLYQEAWAAYLKIPVEYTNSIGMKFRLIPPGEFTMGCTQAEIERTLQTVRPNSPHWKECIESGGPQHTVILTQPIYVGMNEATQAEYELVMKANPSIMSPTGLLKEAVVGIDTTKLPVDNVTWNNAVEFCAGLSRQEKLKPLYDKSGEVFALQEGAGYRLPTEAEWEFACRSGTTTRFWSGDTDDDLARAGWYIENAMGRTHAVGSLKANPFGLFDVHGNVCEWVQDLWGSTYYSEFRDKPAINPVGLSVNLSTSGTAPRVIRAGHWQAVAFSCSVSGRYGNDPMNAFGTFGFRVALTVDAVKLAMVPPPQARALTAAAATAHRMIADWVLQNDGPVTIVQEGIETVINPGTALPPGRFRTIATTFPDQAASRNEVKVLQPYIGTWDMKTETRPCDWNPNGGTASAREKAEWILNETFMWSEHAEPKDTAVRVWFYDVRKKVFVAWLCGDEGVPGEGGAPGRSYSPRNEVPTTLTGSSPPGDQFPLKGTVRLIDQDHYEWTAVFKTQDGRLLMDATGHCTRLKTP